MRSHVSLGQHQCFICLTVFDSGEVLLHKQLAQVLESKTVTGYGTCDECKQRLIESVALIGAEDERGEQRTGEIAWLKRDAFARIMNVPIPPKGIAFIEPAAIAKLKGMMQP